MSIDDASDIVVSHRRLKRCKQVVFPYELEHHTVSANDVESLQFYLFQFPNNLVHIFQPCKHLWGDVCVSAFICITGAPI